MAAHVCSLDRSLSRAFGVGGGIREGENDRPLVQLRHRLDHLRRERAAGRRGPYNHILV